MSREHRKPERPKLRHIGRSGLRRYPRELAASIKEASGGNGGGGGAEREHLTAPDLEAHDMAAAWLGHASVMLRIAGVTILTDPVFSARIGMKVGPAVFGPARLGERHIRPSTVPTPDLILISHAHFDHLDKPTLRRMASERTTVVTATRTRRLVPRGFGNVLELEWDESFEFRGVRIGAMRPEHWGARTAVDRRRRYNAYTIEASGSRALFAGDTAHTQAFAGSGPFDLAIFGIGAYDPWIHAHATPEQVWEMFKGLPAERLLPMHHSTFKLSDEHPDEPLERLLAAAGAADEEHRVVGRSLGEVWAK